MPGVPYLNVRVSGEPVCRTGLYGVQLLPGPFSLLDLDAYRVEVSGNEIVVSCEREASRVTI